MSYKLLQAAARVKALKPHERCVLITLADRANHKTRKCWPSVATMAQDSGVSEREVHRALKKFRALGLITTSGKTKYGTNVYSLHLNETTASAEEEPEDCHPDVCAPAQLAAQQCLTGSKVLTMGHTNKGTEPGTEQEKQNTNISTIKPVLAYAHAEKQQQQTSQKQAKATNWKEDFLKGAGIQEDSKLVKAWKIAHNKAGLKCYASALDGKKLSLLVKGEKAISYQQAIEVLIPRAVADWKVMCVYLSQKYGVSYWGKKPTPKWPHAGFLLKYRQAALEFCAKSPNERQTIISLYVDPFLKKNAWAA